MSLGLRLLAPQTFEVGENRLSEIEPADPAQDEIELESQGGINDAQAFHRLIVDLNGALVHEHEAPSRSPATQPPSSRTCAEDGQSTKRLLDNPITSEKTIDKVVKMAIADIATNASVFGSAV